MYIYLENRIKTHNHTFPSNNKISCDEKHWSNTWNREKQNESLKPSVYDLLLFFASFFWLVSPYVRYIFLKHFIYQVTLLFKNFQWLPIASSSKSKHISCLFLIIALLTSPTNSLTFFSSSTHLLCSYCVPGTGIGAGDMPVNQSDTLTDILL